ncbi:MAG: S8 family serine peptidase [Clostridia bacterium]|nr:S8 family serine peptidase [Clostridia bacterium]
MKAFASRNGIFAVILIAILVIFAGMAIMPANVAYAALPESYCDYIENLDAGSVKDWYFGEDYLNISEVLEVVNSWKTSPDFDIEPLKDEPIIIAVIDSGIGHAYSVDGSGNETPAPKKDYYKIVDDDGNMLNYRINPMFEDVILTDADGNYVFKSVVTENKRGKQIFATLDDSVNDIAYVLADNADDNHGTHVTGTVALLIHALDLEDYVKILPIKANDSVQKGTLTNKYTAHYMLDDVKKAMDFARENGADIVSLSLTADKKSSFRLQAAVS